jgi:nitroreductase
MASSSRRELLQRAGAGALAVAAIGGGGIAWRLVQQSVLQPGAGDAYAAWNAVLGGAGALSLVRAAVLAANAHDTQPWFFEVTDRRIDLFADRSRNIGSLDPVRREMEVSLGCALENLVIAGRAQGLGPVITMLPDPADSDHIARVELRAGASEGSPLFGAIPRRRTDRGAFSGRAVDPSVLADLAQMADDASTRLVWLEADPAKSRFAGLTVDATAAIIGDAQQASDDFAWYRQDWDEIQRKRDGITLDASGLAEPVRIIARALPPKDRSTLQSGWLDATRTRHVATAAAFGLVLVRDRLSTRERVAAGRLFQRVHLSATTRDLAIQPLNQLIERADRELYSGLAPNFSRALETLTPAGWAAVMAFRIGYPTSSPNHSPRRMAEAVIRPA